MELEASQTAVMWNAIFDPLEAGPVAPVSRAWGDPYVMFEYASLPSHVDSNDCVPALLQLG